MAHGPVDRSGRHGRFGSFWARRLRSRRRMGIRTPRVLIRSLCGSRRRPDRGRLKARVVEEGRRPMTLEFWYTALLVAMLGASGLFGLYVIYRLLRD
jgi:hypothetical protein